MGTRDVQQNGQSEPKCRKSLWARAIGRGAGAHRAHHGREFGCGNVGGGHPRRLTTRADPA